MPHIQQSNQPVTKITFVEAEAGKQAEALSLMTERAQFMARQPGFISISLHRSLDEKRIVNSHSVTVPPFAIEVLHAHSTVPRLPALPH